MLNIWGILYNYLCLISATNQVCMSVWTAITRRILEMELSNFMAACLTLRLCSLWVIKNFATPTNAQVNREKKTPHTLWLVSLAQRCGLRAATMQILFVDVIKMPSQMRFHRASQADPSKPVPSREASKQGNHPATGKQTNQAMKSNNSRGSRSSSLVQVGVGKTGDCRLDSSEMKWIWSWS